MGIFKNKKESESSVVEKERGMELHIVAEVMSDMKLKYLRDCGISITDVHTSLDDAMAALMINSNKCRVIVIEKRRGLFTSTQGVSILNDLLGMCDGDNRRYTVFYSNKDIKPEKIKKTKVKWLQYTGIKEVAGEILSYNEEYLDSGIGVSKTDKIIVKVDGGRQKEFTGIQEVLSDIKNGEMLPAFNIKY